MINFEYLNELWGFSSRLYNFQNKERCAFHEVETMLLRTQEMFRYENLPITVDKRNLELWAQCCGAVCFTNKPDGKFRVFYGSFGGTYTPNYRPQKFIIDNPYLNYNAELDIIWEPDDEGDCVVILNDSLYRGLLPIHRKYATMTVENELSLKVADILARMPTILKADDENTRKSAEQFLSNIEDGKIGIVQDNEFLEGLQDVQISNQVHMLFHGLVEYEQYIHSRWLGDLGLNSNYNLKREAISDAEKAMNEDELLPLIDNMLEERQKAIDLINSKFDLDIKVEFNSSWEDNEKEIELEQAIMEAEANGSDASDNGSDISTEDRDGESNGSEETSDGGDRISTEQEGSPEDSEATSDDSGADKGDNINIEVNIEVNSDENKVSEEVKEDDETEENS